MLLDSDLKKDFGFDGTENRTLKSIVRVIDVASNENSEDDSSHGTTTDTDAHQKIILEIEESIHDEPAPETSVETGQPGPLAYGPIEVADYLLIAIEERTLNGHFSRTHENSMLRKCLARRRIHITPGYYHMMEERDRSFLTRKIFNQYMAVIESFDSDLEEMVSEKFFYAFYHLVVGTYEHVLTKKNT